ncbi:MAG: bifunctional phosphoribosyl-AMP cyclohydrolase/phosphoribosyl-ATP diphosphatase HisIE [Reichenbachiella sp.]|uniref:bifunctional phosphoribosyl-AMP cyclohydrolase/phosphoribosyl-ATP diphosphatase HisIE n=1 Tax=Reichenbachiella sp. TaxID=2184521 RepID=UPI0029665CCB|nr:bifunctional phosphoribosyl-AMP cyclohydrolase/phosphoribosyl-ATP diphosphatase HisIE [Reichenbachiella sp.]MDW3208290.1 bifunctional phosphoribosyl-AMP cyclohydrolase/phosphoribosyl-ATP diphosphatase HisIE [Reichenbachiella sp.]
MDNPLSKIDYNKTNGLVPAIIQDAKTKNVLMLGYMNEEAVAKTQETGNVTFYSRSKERLWTKGEESGNFLELVDLKVDCDNDTLLIQAKPVGPTCHKGTDTCWGEANSSNFAFLSKLEAVIKDRHDNPDEESYTSSLFKKGINKVAQKVGEEAVEVVIEAKDNSEELFLNESADLLYHYMILLRAKGYDLEDVVKVLEDRH